MSSARANLADVDNDYKIDIFDCTMFAGYFGQSVGAGLGAPTQPSLGGTPTPEGAVVSVDPSQATVFKGEVFNVNVSLVSVTDLAGWEFKLYWNSTVLDCTNIVIQSPTEWQNKTQDYGTGLENSYNATHARFWKAETAAYPAPSFNGSMTIATLTFIALQPGTTSLMLTEVKLGNSTAQPIDYTATSGSVTVYYGRYMRSDTATINGLNAYLLNATARASSAFSRKTL